MGKRWTSELDEVLRQLRRNGSTFEEISRVIGVTRSAVAGRVSRLPFRQRRRKARSVPQPAPVEEAATPPPPAI